ncbi:MAG: hypothetical protein P8X64_09965 [Anaerolineales bacterium]
MAKVRLYRLAALGGIFFVVMQVVGQGLIQVGGAEPAFTASADEIIQFFRQRDTTLFAIGAYISALSVVPYFWFLGALWGFLRESEGKYGWLSMAAIGSGLILPAISLIGGWELAMLRLGENVDPSMIQLLFDAGNFAFAGIWVISGSMLLAVSSLGLTSGNLPRWFSWFGAAIGVALLAARAVWTTQIAFIPYTLFWLWMIVMSLILVRKPASKAAGT